jgi:hypothetical protein
MPRCPDEIADPLLEILYRSSLAVRSAGGRGNARVCELEAEHVHNLPELIRSFDPKYLRIYLDLTRPSFVEAMRETPGGDVRQYQELWMKLERMAA